VTLIRADLVRQTSDRVHPNGPTTARSEPARTKPISPAPIYLHAPATRSSSSRIHDPRDLDSRRPPLPPLAVSLSPTPWSTAPSPADAAASIATHRPAQLALPSFSPKPDSRRRLFRGIHTSSTGRANDHPATRSSLSKSRQQSQAKRTKDLVRVRRAILVTIHKRTPTPTQLANKHTYNACLSSPLRYHHSATAEHSPTPTNGQPVSPDLTSFHPIPRPISVHHLGVTLPPHPHLQPRASAAPPNSLPRSLLAGRRSTPSSPRHHLLVQVPRWVQTHVTRSTSRGTALQTAPYRTPLHRTASLRPTLPNPNHPDRCSTLARSWNPQAIPVIHWKHRRTLFGSNFVLSRPDQHRTVDHSTAPEP
jgi:hypothetical protein